MKSMRYEWIHIQNVMTLKHSLPQEMSFQFDT